MSSEGCEAPLPVTYVVLEIVYKGASSYIRVQQSSPLYSWALTGILQLHTLNHTLHYQIPSICLLPHPKTLNMGTFYLFP
jgi:hypothetical protein